MTWEEVLTLPLGTKVRLPWWKNTTISICKIPETKQILGGSGIHVKTERGEVWTIERYFNSWIFPINFEIQTEWTIFTETQKPKRWWQC